MLYIGCHLSSSKGFAAMGRQALELGANTFQFFTRNPRGSRAKSNKKRGLPAETGDPAETLPDAGKAAAPSGGGLICFGRADRLHRL